MQNIFKNLLVVLGGLMIGFGIGMITSSSFIFGETKYWVAVVVSLILGGFFTALGLTGKKKVEKKITEDEEEKKEEKEKETTEEGATKEVATKEEDSSESSQESEEKP
jgi:uncharacterized protein YacL